MAITAASGCGGLGTVTETLPAGAGCASGGLDDEEVQVTARQVRFTVQRASPSQYIVNAPSEEGAYSFSGMLRGSDRKNTPAGGTSLGRAIVQQPSHAGPPLRPPPEQLAQLPCGGGERLRGGHPRVHPVIDDN